MNKNSHEIVAIIRDIRRSRNLEINILAFHDLVDKRGDAVLSELSVRWLVSICDTLADHGNEIERRNALLVSMFINTLRMAEAVSAISGPFQPQRICEVKNSRVEFFDGVMMFDIDRQDVYLNLCKRTVRALQETPFLLALWNEILGRIHKKDNAITRFRALSDMPERYFPLDPLAMPDNYGVV